MSLAQTAAPVAPVPPSIAELSIPERMLEVMRRRRFQGQPTTLSDFLEAEETCDLSEAVLCANIGAAKRLIHPETVRHDHPFAPIMPWQLDPDYRKERVEKAAGILVDLPLDQCSPTAFGQLHLGFSARELDELWHEIIDAAHHLIQRRKFAGA